MTTQSAPTVEKRVTKHLEQPERRSHSFKHEGLLVIVTLIWGSTFLVVKYAVALSGPFTYLAISYGIGGLALTFIFHKRLKQITRSEVLSGLVLGMILFTGYALQANGLRYTTVSKAGFITGLSIPLVPVFAFLLFKFKPSPSAIVGFILSLIGLFLISFNNTFNFTFGYGELLILGAAIAFALHIVNVSKFAPNADAMNLAIVQLTLTSMLSFITILFTHEPLRMPPVEFWASVLFMGIVDIAFTLSAMIWVQQVVSSTGAALIYALEPMWAALFGMVLAGDSLSIPACIGCGLILMGMIAGSLSKTSVPWRKRQ